MRRRGSWGIEAALWPPLWSIGDSVGSVVLICKSQETSRRFLHGYAFPRPMLGISIIPRSNHFSGLPIESYHSAFNFNAFDLI
jgi:hypothetical protein